MILKLKGLTCDSGVCKARNVEVGATCDGKFRICNSELQCNNNLCQRVIGIGDNCNVSNHICEIHITLNSL